MLCLRSTVALALACFAMAAHGQAAKAPAKAAPAEKAPAQAAPAAPAAAAPAPAAPAKVVGNAANGRNKVYQCQGCHGIADWKSAFPEVYRVPKLGGQKADYIVAALKMYKSGEREFPTMRGMVMDMTDQDMADVAAYYAESNINTAETKK